MAVLHGSWVVLAAGSRQQTHSSTSAVGFFLWGEKWRRAAPHRLTAPENAVLGEAPKETDGGFHVPAHPYGMGAGELGQWLISLQVAGQLQWPAKSLSLKDLAETSAMNEAWRSLSVLLPSHVLAAHAIDADALGTEAPDGAPSVGEPDPAPPERESEKGDSSPCRAVLPQHSGSVLPNITKDNPILDEALTLHPWRLSGVWLSAADAVALLHSLPLSLADQESTWGTDLRFWSHVSRW
ncbi:MAG: hypothetical protein ACFB4J_01210, partial [Elainellaceae cyanobacterium]